MRGRRSKFLALASFLLCLVFGFGAMRDLYIGLINGNALAIGFYVSYAYLLDAFEEPESVISRGQLRIVFTRLSWPKPSALLSLRC